MTISKADWPTVGGPVDPDDESRLFFTDHEWETIDAACARIIPTDHDPGAREARVVRFIDRYLSGIGYIYAAADGSGFLQMSGKLADAWRARVTDMQKVYREGIRQLDGIANDHNGKPFKELDEENQDRVLEHLSGRPKPAPVSFGRGQEVRSFLQGTFDEGMPFFDALALHTRQGFYSDPVYGGNKGHIGWQVIGFPGPKTLKETNDLTYSVREHFELDADWRDLVPRLEGKPVPEIDES
jgi:gluconate 2-dehydrogenase gamma chain